MMSMHDEVGLIEKLQKIEALFARPGTDGERLAAAKARDRIRERLREIERAEPTIEYHFSPRDRWSHDLLRALLRRYGISPYRYRGQRRITVMAKVTKTFMEDTLWPEFQQADRLLREYLIDVTQRVIAAAISDDVSDLEELATSQPKTAPPEQRMLDLG